MDDMGLTAQPNDKDPGYTIESNDVHAQVMEEILSSSQYEEISPSEVQLPQLHESYGKLCRRVASCAGDASLTSKLTNSLHMKHASVFCLLTTTVRTHKAQGKVEHRNIHSSFVNSLAGLSMWYASALRFQLQNSEHILASTDDFVKKN